MMTPLKSLIIELEKRDLQAFAVALDQYLQVPGHTIDDQDIFNKKTLLMSAADMWYPEGVYFLLDHNADPNIKPYFGLNYYALTIALDNSDYITAEALVHYGGNIQNIRAGNGGIYDIKEISKLFWSALRVMSADISVSKQIYGYSDDVEGELPEQILTELLTEVSDVVKEHNKKLFKHPEVTSQSIIQQTPLSLPLIQIIGDYLYGDEGVLANFKTVIFKGPSSNEPNKKTKRETDAPEVAGTQEPNQQNKRVKA